MTKGGLCPEPDQIWSVFESFHYLGTAHSWTYRLNGFGVTKGLIIPHKSMDWYNFTLDIHHVLNHEAVLMLSEPHVSSDLGSPLKALSPTIAD